MEIGPLVLEKKIFFFKFSVYFCYHIPLKTEVALHMNNSEHPLPKDGLCQLWPRSSGECKSLTDRQTDRQATDDQKGSLELSPQVS
jgi:hypothetical protein